MNGWLATQKRSSCAINATTVSCSSDPNAIQSWLMTPSVANYLTNFGTQPATVNDLLNLANDMLGRVRVPGIDGVPSFIDVTRAIDIINNAFVNCRQYIGYYGCEVDCSNISSPCSSVSRNTIVSGEAVNKLTTVVYPNPYTQSFRININSPVSGLATIEFYTVTGVKIYEVRQNVTAGRTNTIEIRPTSVFTQQIMYRLRVDKYQASGIVLRLSE
jgi:hypothetical protein